MFTKIANGILWLGIVAGIIASIILGVNLGGQMNNGFIGFLIFLLCSILVIVLFTAFGVFVEIAINISDCKKILENIYKTKVLENTNDTENSRPHQSYDLKSMLREKRTSPLNDYWNCPNCGEQNTTESLFCINCGNRKP